MREQSDKKKVYLILANILLSLLLVMTTAVTITLAVKQFNVGIGGNISFQATDVQASISKGVITNGTVADAVNKMQALTITPDNNDEASVVGRESWSGLVITFDGVDDVTISFTITNNHTEKGLNVNFEPTPGTKTNMEMTSTIDGANVTTKVIPAKTTPETDTTIDCKITFHITDSTKSASIQGFNLKCDLTLAD